MRGPEFLSGTFTSTSAILKMESRRWEWSSGWWELIFSLMSCSGPAHSSWIQRNKQEIWSGKEISGSHSDAAEICKSSEMLYHVDWRLEELQDLWKRRFLFNCLYGVISHKTCNLKLWYCIAGLKPRSPRHFERQYSAWVSLNLRPPISVTWLQLLRKQTNTDTPTALTAEHKDLRAHFAHSPDVMSASL